MKKVLIIGFFSPYREGSARVPRLAKYLPEFGWQPIILTAPLHRKPDPQCRAIEVPYCDVLCNILNFGKRLLWKRLFGINPNESMGRYVEKQFGITSKKSFVDFFYKYYNSIFKYPDRYASWKSYALEAASGLIKNENIDAIISVWPVTSHLIANELKNRYKIPWVADFPDLWSQNHDYSYGSLRKFFDQNLELKTLQSADVLTTVSKNWAEKLRMLHKQKLIYATPHGFHPTDLNIPPAKLSSKFTITYTGTIYIGNQDPSKLFAALKDLISEGNIDPNDVEIRFYGCEYRAFADDIKKYDLSNIVKVYGRVPRSIAVEKQRESQVLLILNWGVSWKDQREKGWYPFKIFEYLAAQRPILATGGFGNDVVEELLNETKAGIYASTVKEIKIILGKLYSEYKLNGKISYNGDIKKINKYSSRKMTEKFTEILDGLIQKDQEVDK